MPNIMNPDTAGGGFAPEETADVMHLEEPQTQLGTQRDLKKAVNQNKSNIAPDPAQPANSAKPKENQGPDLSGLGKVASHYALDALTGGATEWGPKLLDIKKHFNTLHPVDWVNMATAYPEALWHQTQRMYNVWDQTVFNTPLITQSLSEAGSNAAAHRAIFGVVPSEMNPLETPLQWTHELEQHPQTYPIVHDAIPLALMIMAKYGPALAGVEGILQGATEGGLGETVASGAGAVQRFLTPEAQAGAPMLTRTALAGQSLAGRAAMFITGQLPQMILDHQSPQDLMKYYSSIPGELWDELTHWHWTNDAQQNSRLFNVLIGGLVFHKELHGVYSDVLGKYMPDHIIAGKNVLERAQRVTVREEDKPQAERATEATLANREIDPRKPTPPQVTQFSKTAPHATNVLDGFLHKAALEDLSKEPEQTESEKFYSQESGIPAEAYAPPDADTMPIDEQVYDEAEYYMKHGTDEQQAFAKKILDRVAQHKEALKEANDPRIAAHGDFLVPEEHWTPQQKVALEDAGHLAHFEAEVGMKWNDAVKKIRGHDVPMTQQQYAIFWDQLATLEQAANHYYDRTRIRPDEPNLQGERHGTITENMKNSANPSAANEVRTTYQVLRMHIKNNFFYNPAEVAGSVLRVLAGEMRATNYILQGHMEQAMARSINAAYDSGRLLQSPEYLRHQETASDLRAQMLEARDLSQANPADAQAAAAYKRAQKAFSDHNAKTPTMATSAKTGIAEAGGQIPLRGRARSAAIQDALYGKMDKTTGYRSGGWGEEMTKFMLGDELAGKILPPELRAMVQEAQRTGYEFLQKHRDLGTGLFEEPGYWPMVQRALRRTGGKPYLSPGFAEAHKLTDGVRQEIIKKKSNTELTAELKNKGPFDGNKQSAAAIRNLADQLSGGGKDVRIGLTEPMRALLNQRGISADELTAELQKIPEGERVAKAYEIAREVFPQFETNFFEVIPGWLRKETAHVHGLEAMHTLAHSIYNEGGRMEGGKLVDSTSRDGGFVLQHEADPKARAEMQKRAEALGYVHMKDHGYEGVYLHPEIAKMITDLEDARKWMDSQAFAARLFRAQSQLKAAIVYFPAIHGANVLGRAMTYSLIHAPSLFRELKNRGAIGGNHVSDVEKLAENVRLVSAGLMPPQMSLQDMAGQLGFRNGNMDNIAAPGIFRRDEMPLDWQNSNWDANHPMSYVTRAAQKAHHIGNYALWHSTFEFGKFVAHTEEHIARKTMDPATARLLAVDTANSWMGHVRPERWNPGMHHVLSAAMFAPNWWRTWAELFIPTMRDKSGLTINPKLKAHLMQQEVRHAIGFAVAQSLTGNAFNMYLSGHSQADNQEGSRHAIEITDHDVLQALLDFHAGKPLHDLSWWHGGKLGEILGTAAEQIPAMRYAEESWLPRKYNKATDSYEIAMPDPNTDSRMTITNPFFKQATDTEKLFGDVGGAPLTQADPGTHLRRAEEVGLAVANPAINMLAAAGNLDLYSTVHTGQTQLIDPSGESAANLFAFLQAGLPAYATGGLAGQKAIEQYLQDGTVVPRSSKVLLDEQMRSMAGGMLQQLFGINPPYEASMKTEGANLSTQQRQQLQDVQSKYNTQEAAAAAQALQGAYAGGWSQWLKDYKHNSSGYHSEVKAFFINAPHYEKGIFALADNHDALYDQATNPVTGEIDFAKYDKLNADFMANLTADERRQLQAFEQQGELKNPMLKIYHQTLRDYVSMQDEAAIKLHMDGSTLRQQIAEYNALFGDQVASARYKARHPQLARYERMKKTWETTTGSGMAYGLFYDSSIIMSYLQRKYPGRSPDEFKGYVEPGIAQELTAEAATRGDVPPQPSMAEQEAQIESP